MGGDDVIWHPVGRPLCVRASDGEKRTEEGIAQRSGASTRKDQPGRLDENVRRRVTEALR